MSDVLVVCTANQCRSPMAEAFLAREFEAADVAATVASAGVDATDGRPVVPGVTRALRRSDVGVDDHVSRRLTRELVDDAALIVTMERAHVREVTLLASDAWPRTFTLKELVRRGEAVGPRGAGEGADEWLVRVHRGRRPQDLVGSNPADDIEDPMGGAPADYERTAEELDALVRRLVDLVAPPGVSA
jgi:protein-tyrosine phosphatase